MNISTPLSYHVHTTVYTTVTTVLLIHSNLAIKVSRELKIHYSNQINELRFGQCVYCTMCGVEAPLV